MDCVWTNFNIGLINGKILVLFLHPLNIGRILDQIRRVWQVKLTPIAHRRPHAAPTVHRRLPVIIKRGVFFILIIFVLATPLLDGNSVKVTANLKIGPQNPILVETADKTVFVD